MLHLNLQPFPELTTDRLILRQPTEDDLNELYYLRTDEDVNRYTDITRPNSVDDVRNWLKSVTQYHADNEAVLWAICLKTDNKLIGTICYWGLDELNHRIGIGYVLATEWHGKGIMNEAMQRVISYGFEHMRLHSIEAMVNPANEASVKLLLRNGFLQEAYFRENHYYNGKFLDTAVYGRITHIL